MEFKKSAVAILLIVVCVFSLFGCSKKEESKKSLEAQATSSDATGLNAAARLLAEGILEGDGDKVFAQISTNCQQEISRTETSKQIKQTISYVVNIFGASMEDFSVEEIEVRDVTDGKTGQARYSISVTGKSRDALKKLAEESKTYAEKESESETSTTLPFDEPTEWFDFIYEDSSWRLESCQEFLEAAILASPQKESTKPSK